MDFKYFVYFELIKQLDAAQENQTKAKERETVLSIFCRSKSIELKAKMSYVAKKWK